MVDTVQIFMVLTAAHGDIIGHSGVEMVKVAQNLKEETGFFSNFYYFSLLAAFPSACLCGRPPPIYSFSPDDYVI